jgi:hypothetical protein
MIQLFRLRAVNLKGVAVNLKEEAMNLHKGVTGRVFSLGIIPQSLCLITGERFSIDCR